MNIYEMRKCQFIFKSIITEKYIGMDNASGGYPWETDNLFAAHTYNTVQAAINYKRHFKNECWKLYRVDELILTEILF